MEVVVPIRQVNVSGHRNKNGKPIYVVEWKQSGHPWWDLVPCEWFQYDDHKKKLRTYQVGVLKEFKDYWHWILEQELFPESLELSSDDEFRLRGVTGRQISGKENVQFQAFWGVPYSILETWQSMESLKNCKEMMLEFLKPAYLEAGGTLPRGYYELLAKWSSCLPHDATCSATDSPQVTTDPGSSGQNELLPTTVSKEVCSKKTVQEAELTTLDSDKDLIEWTSIGYNILPQVSSQANECGSVLPIPLCSSTPKALEVPRATANLPGQKPQDLAIGGVRLNALPVQVDFARSLPAQVPQSCPLIEMKGNENLEYPLLALCGQIVPEKGKRFGEAFQASKSLPQASPLSCVQQNAAMLNITSTPKLGGGTMRPTTLNFQSYYRKESTGQISENVTTPSPLSCTRTPDSFFFENFEKNIQRENLPTPVSTAPQFEKYNLIELQTINCADLLDESARAE